MKTIRTQTLLMVTGLLVAAVLATAGAVGWISRRALLAETERQGLVTARLLARSAAFGVNAMTDIENAVGEQMVVEATIAAHLVAMAEDAGVGAAEISRRLRRIADETVLDEFWITDSKGHAYLRNIADIEFAFSPDSVAQPQAHVFWPLLAGGARAVVQEARPRDVDDQIFKYAGVAGVDKPRIVQVGYHATHLEQLRARMGLGRLIDELLLDGSVVSIRVLDSSLKTVEYAERGRPDASGDPTATERAELSSAAAGGTRTFREGAHLKVVAPIDGAAGAVSGGAILVTLPLDPVRAVLGEQTRLALVASALVLVLGSAFALFGASTITKPITDLIGTARRIEAADFTQRLDMGSTNEMGTTKEIRAMGEAGALAASFRKLARRLNRTVDSLSETTAAKERIERELQVAREIQASMVPQTFPPFPDRREFDVYATLVPAREVGGDLYDFFLIGEDRLCFAVGDVSGKGVPAALFMAVTRTLFRAAAATDGTPGEILASINADLVRDNGDSAMFVTFFCGILDIRSGVVEYSSAGHNPPYHLHGEGASLIPNIGGRALGLLDGSPYTSGRLVLRPGDTLLLYTDGVTEAMTPDEMLYSEAQLERFLSATTRSSPRELVEELVGDVRRHAGTAPQSDDITVLALTYAGDPKASDEIVLRNDVSEIARLHETVAALGARHDLSARVVHDVCLALEEIVTNIIAYAYDDDAGRDIRVSLRCGPGEVTAEVVDDGRPFNPLDAPRPDTAAPLEDRPVGGLGIHLVRELMDRLAYARRGHLNVLSIARSTVERSHAPLNPTRRDDGHS